MAEFKLIINDPKTGKSYKKVLETDAFRGKKIGNQVSGGEFGLKGYELEITGGSDKVGFPMRKDNEGVHRKKALLTKGLGMKKKRKGLRLRRTIAGNTIHAGISQINLKITKYGAESSEKLLGVEKKEVEEKKE